MFLNKKIYLRFYWCVYIHVFLTYAKLVFFIKKNIIYDYYSCFTKNYLLLNLLAIVKLRLFLIN